MMTNTKGKNIFRAISLLVMAVFLAVTLGGCYPDRDSQARVRAAATQAAAKAEMAKLAKERSKPTTAEKLTELTKDLSEVLVKADAGDVSALKKSKVKLVSLDKTINKEFKDTESKLNKINAKVALKRHDKFVADYEKKMAKLNKGLTSVTKAKGKKNRLAEAKKLRKYVATLIPKEKHQPLGSSLPHRNVDYQAGPPTLGVNIAPAYMGVSPDLEPSSLPRTPTEDDLAATVDTSQTEAIRDLADRLDKDPVKIYEFVRNNIVYEPYYGSRKGAQETLWEKGGNDVDQANLLIALYRYSNIPARYVTGVVEIPIDRAMNWVGVEKEEVAAKVFSAAGIPSKAMVSGGKISAIQMEHTWAEAYVNYSNYRGVDAGSGEKAWVGLDASYKRVEYKDPVDVKAIAGIDTSSLLTTDTAVLQDKINEATAALESYIAENMPGATLGDVIGAKKIIEEELGLLPSGLPEGIKTVSVINEQSSLRDETKYRLHLTGAGLDYEVPLSLVAGKPLTLVYSPATTEDAQIIEEYGGLYAVPAYLAKVVPVLFLDEQPVDVGSPVQIGESQAIKAAIIKPNGANETVVKMTTAGASYGVGLNLGKIPSEVLKNGYLEFKDIINRVQNTGELIAHDQIVGRLLNEVVLNYFTQSDMAKDINARLGRVAYTSETSLGFAEQALNVSDMFGVPARVKGAGLTLDIKIDAANVQAKDGSNQARFAWTMTTGILSSAAEHNIFETMFKAPAVSTARVLEQANATGIDVLNITANNSELAKLQATGSVLEAVRNAIAAGRTVIIPSKEVTYHDWSGFGWIDLDPVSGSAGYLISGGLAGGAMADANDMSMNALDILLAVAATTWHEVVLRPQTITRGGLQVVVNRNWVNGQFASGAYTGAIKGVLDWISLLVLPIVFAVQQGTEDYHNNDLASWQKFERALLSFLVGATFSLAMVFLLPSLAFMGPVGVVIMTLVLTAFVTVIWERFKEDIFERVMILSLSFRMTRAGYRYA